MEKKFQKDVDNQTDQNRVKNIMVGPVYGHRNEHLRQLHPDIATEKELGETKKKALHASDLNRPGKTFKEINHSEPIGVIQLINKKDYKDINEYDKKKFEAIQNLLGLSINNTSEYNSILNIRLGMYEHMRNLIEGLRSFQTLSIPPTTADARSDESISGISYIDVEQIYQSKKLISTLIEEFESQKQVLFKDIGIRNPDELEYFLKS